MPTHSLSRERLSDTDHALIQTAQELIKRHGDTDRHAVSCALRSSSGKIYLGLHLETYVGRMAVCAESVAVGNAALNNDIDIETIVSIYKTGDIVSPCGICRELITDYSSNARIILADDNGPYKVAATELLPAKYTRELS